jgi:peroxiredoxin
MRKPTAFLAGCVVLLTVLVAVLAAQMRPLRAQARELAWRKALPYLGQVQPTLRVRSLSGEELVIGETGPHRAQLLFFFSPSCPYCEESAPGWNRASASLRDAGDSVEVYWISLGNAADSREWARTHGVRDPVLMMPAGKPRATWRIKGVPLTLVLDWQGQVRYVRPSVIARPATIDSIVRAARTISVTVGPSQAAVNAASPTY